MALNVFILTGLITLVCLTFAVNTGREQRFLDDTGITDRPITTGCCTCDDEYVTVENNCSVNCGNEHKFCPNYCMTTITVRNGRVMTKKSCGSEDECIQGFSQTSKNADCFSPNKNLSPGQKCVLCCKQPGLFDPLYCLNGEELKYTNFSDKVTSPSTTQISSTSVSSTVSTATTPVTSSTQLGPSNSSRCQICTSPTSCYHDVCPDHEPYCMNVLHDGIVLEKGCASYAECYYDANSKQHGGTGCDVPPTSTSATPLLCRYCCQNSDPATACNIHDIPSSGQLLQYTPGPTLTTTPVPQTTTTTPKSTQTTPTTTPVPQTRTATPKSTPTTPTTTPVPQTTTETPTSTPTTPTTTPVPQTTTATPKSTPTTPITTPVPQNTTTTPKSTPTTPTTTPVPQTTTATPKSTPTSPTTTPVPQTTTATPKSTPTTPTTTPVPQTTTATPKSTPTTPTTTPVPQTTTATPKSTPTTPTTTPVPQTTTATPKSTPTTPTTTPVPQTTTATPKSTTTTPSTTPVPQTTTATPKSTPTTPTTTSVPQTTTATPKSPTSNVTTSSNTIKHISTQLVTKVTTVQNTIVTSLASTATTTHSSGLYHHLLETKCAICAGPLKVCERIYRTATCTPPNNYCINTLTNNEDGTRTVNRACGNFVTCYREWYLGTSDNDRCMTFDARFVQTRSYECTYCCIKDNCNTDILPPQDTLYNSNL